MKTGIGFCVGCFVGTIGAALIANAPFAAFMIGSICGFFTAALMAAANEDNELSDFKNVERRRRERAEATRREPVIIARTGMPATGARRPYYRQRIKGCR